MADEVSTEQLRHYRCTRCEQLGRYCWWSIADGPTWCPCPWCERERAEDLRRELERQYWLADDPDGEASARSPTATGVRYPGVTDGEVED